MPIALWMISSTFQTQQNASCYRFGKSTGCKDCDRCELLADEMGEMHGCFPLASYGRVPDFHWDYLVPTTCSYMDGYCWLAGRLAPLQLHVRCTMMMRYIWHVGARCLFIRITCVIVLRRAYSTRAIYTYALYTRKKIVCFMDMLR